MIYWNKFILSDSSILIKINFNLCIISRFQLYLCRDNSICVNALFFKLSHTNNSIFNILPYNSMEYEYLRNLNYYICMLFFYNFKFLYFINIRNYSNNLLSNSFKLHTTFLMYFSNFIFNNIAIYTKFPLLKEQLVYKDVESLVEDGVEVTNIIKDEEFKLVRKKYFSLTLDCIDSLYKVKDNESHLDINDWFLYFILTKLYNITFFNKRQNASVFKFDLFYKIIEKNKLIRNRKHISFISKVINTKIILFKYIYNTSYINDVVFYEIFSPTYTYMEPIAHNIEPKIKNLNLVHARYFYDISKLKLSTVDSNYKFIRMCRGVLIFIIKFIDLFWTSNQDLEKNDICIIRDYDFLKKTNKFRQDIFNDNEINKLDFIVKTQKILSYLEVFLKHLVCLNVVYKLSYFNFNTSSKYFFNNYAYLLLFENNPFYNFDSTLFSDNCYSNLEIKNTYKYNNHIPLFNCSEYVINSLYKKMLDKIVVSNFSKKFNYLVLFALEKAFGQRIFIKIDNNKLIDLTKKFDFLIIESLYSYYKIQGNYNFSPRFRLSEAIELLWYAFFYKDLSMVKVWFTLIMESLHYKFHKKFLSVFQILISENFPTFRHDLHVKGFYFEIRGKLGVTGNSKKKHFFFRVGEIRRANKFSKIDFQQDVIKTNAGTIGYTMILHY